MNKLKTMREQVKEEIKHIPKGNLSQNSLRMAYWSGRMNSLGKKAKKKSTKEEILRVCIELVHKEYSDFDPDFDEDFFQIKKSLLIKILNA